MKNFQSYKGRSITDGQRVKVYFNLHNKKYSAVATRGPDKGRVLGHFDRVTLRFVEFTVNETGRQRVLREKRKNVHAYAVGNVLAVDQEWSMACFLRGAYERGVMRVGRLFYNPYKSDRFCANNVPVEHSYMVALDPKGSYVDRYLRAGEPPWWLAPSFNSFIEDKN